MRRILGGTLAASLIVITLTTPAYAASSRHEQTSIVSTDTSKSVSVSCGPTKFLAGMGARVNGGNGMVALTGVVPTTAMTAVTAHAEARVSFTAPWSLTVFAVCIDSPWYVEIVTSPAAPGSSVATATCPAPKVVFSGGFLLPQPTGGGYLTGLVPSVGLSSVTVTAGGTVSSQPGPIAVALCGMYAGWARTSGTSSIDTAASKSAFAGLPVGADPRDTYIVGAGARIIGEGALIDAFTPLAGFDGAMAHAARIAGGQLAKSGPAAAVTESGDWGVACYGNAIGAWYGAPA